MSRRHYIAIAEALRTAESIDEAAREIARTLKADNSAFRFDRFYVACGLDENGRAA